MANQSASLLVASDLSPRSDRPMERALLLARQLDAALVILHVPGKSRLDPNEERMLSAQIRRDFDLPRDGCDIVLDYGPVPEVIARTAEARGSSLILTGVARFNSPRDYLLGTTVDHLVRESPKPVLVVKRRPRQPYKRLLVATDFSPCSADALRSAATMFDKGELRLVHSYHAAWQAFLAHDTTEPLVRDEAERSMEAFLETVPADVRSRTEPVLEEGHLGTVIADQVERWSADLLVVGSHGRSGFAHATIGDTAAELLESAPCDVLVVRSKGEAR